MKEKLTEITPKPKTILELFEGHPERWTKGHSFRDKDGEWSSQEDATCACLMGAARIVYGGEWFAREPIYRLVGGNVIRFNDTHSFEEVLEVVRKAGV